MPPRERGIVRNFDPATGYGFVVTQRGDRNVWLHVKNVVTYGTPYIGARVECTVRKLPGGRSEALNVRIVSDG
jgi:cold shock CspA family protein